MQARDDLQRLRVFDARRAQALTGNGASQNRWIAVWVVCAVSLTPRIKRKNHHGRLWDRFTADCGIGLVWGRGAYIEHTIIRNALEEVPLAEVGLWILKEQDLDDT